MRQQNRQLEIVRTKRLLFFLLAFCVCADKSTVADSPMLFPDNGTGALSHIIRDVDASLAENTERVVSEYLDWEFLSVWKSQNPAGSFSTPGVAFSELTRQLQLQSEAELQTSIETWNAIARHAIFDFSSGHVDEHFSRALGISTSESVFSNYLSRFIGAKKNLLLILLVIWLNLFTFRIALRKTVVKSHLWQACSRVVPIPFGRFPLTIKVTITIALGWILLNSFREKPRLKIDYQQAKLAALISLADLDSLNEVDSLTVKTTNTCVEFAKRELWNGDVPLNLTLTEVETRRLVVAIRKMICAQFMLAEAIDRSDEMQSVANAIDEIESDVRNVAVLEKLTYWIGFLLIIPAFVVLTRRLIPRRIRCYVCGSQNLHTDQEKTYVVCTQHNHIGCGSRLPRIDARANYLKFSTIGLSKSGKTHWLVAVNELVKRLRLPRQWRLQTSFVPDVQRLLQEYWHGFIETGEGRLNPLDRAYHLPIAFRENTWLAENRTVVISDFAGEVTNMDNQGVSDLRRLALQRNGFLFFLDPTQPQEHQEKKFNEFQSQVYGAIGSGINRWKDLNCPVAVVLTKVDLLNQGTLETTHHEEFQECLRVSEQFQKISISEIRRRSEKCLHKMSELFPHWDFDRAVREVFGNRVCYFPTTTIGLDLDDFNDQASRRRVRPFGVMEPLMWLVHMNGFKVFSADRGDFTL